MSLDCVLSSRLETLRLMPPSPRPIHRPLWWRRLLIAVLTPVLLFGGLELGLRLGGYGYDAHFFIPDPAAPSGTYRSNPRFTELFFPASFALKPINFRLPREKPPGTKRIFILGESAAMGVPEPGFGMAPQLQAMLRAAHPDEHIEVISLGITAINSHVILPILRETLRFDPDLLILYMGSNEVLGPYGPGSALTATTPSLAAIRGGIWFKQLRTGQLLAALAGRLQSASSQPGGDWQGLEMFTSRTVAADDPRLAATYSNFADNLATMLNLAADAEVPVLVSTVAVNLAHCAPFTSAPADRDTSAEAHFQAGQAHLRSGDPAAALTAFQQARDADQLRLRADSTINRLIRESTTRTPSAHLTDLAENLGLADRSTFFDHVHFTFSGNHEVASRFFASATGLLWPDSAAPAPASLPATARALGFTAVGQLAQWQTMNDLLRRPPFTQQSTYSADRGFTLRALQHWNEEVTSTGLPALAEQVDTARQASPDRPFLAFHAAKLASQLGDYNRTLTLLDETERLAPANAESTVLRAYALARLGQPTQAIAQLEQLAAREPYYPQTYPLLASLWVGTGQLDTARTAFAAWTAAQPRHRDLHLAYAQVLEAAGDHPAAVAQWEAVLQIMPDDERALWPLLQDLLRRDDFDGALDRMLAAHAYNPRNATNNDRLVQVYQQRGEPARTLTFMEDLIRSGPVSSELRAELQRLRASVAVEP